MTQDQSRWCVTVTGPDGTATAHGCARGQHPWTPEPAGTSHARAGPDPRQAAQLRELLRRLDVTLAPIAKDTCDHRHREDRYAPGRTLKHLVRARTLTCSAPGCGAQAYYCDLDHSIPYPAGITCECGLAPVCRRHHRCKQAPGWRLAQPQPGIMLDHALRPDLRHPAHRLRGVTVGIVDLRELLLGYVPGRAISIFMSIGVPLHPRAEPAV